MSVAEFVLIWVERLLEEVVETCSRIVIEELDDCMGIMEVAAYDSERARRQESEAETARTVWQ